jgi:hypothetical protein
VADMFTKPMRNANDFHKLRRVIMNESPRLGLTSSRGGASASGPARRMHDVS